MFRKTLLAAIIGTISLAHAARWNDENLASARQQAEAEINQYLQKGTGPIAKLADANIREWLTNAQYSKDKKGAANKDLAHLQNSAVLLAKLAERSEYSDDNRSIAFRALLAASPDLRGSKEDWLSDTLALYEVVMRNDNDSVPFALAALAKLAPDFSDRQKEQYNNLYNRFAFKLSDVSVDNKQDKPQICLEFSEPLLAAPQQDWRQRISITPAPEDEGRYSGDKICYTGVWQREYQVRIDPKLAAQNHLELGREETRSINTENREPMVRFATRGKTLILDPDAALTVESSNVEKINLELWQIPGNNLAGDAHEAIDDPSDFEAYNLGDSASKIWTGSFEPEKSDTNSIVQSRIAFADMAGKETRSGVYVLTVRAKDQYENALLGFTVTDQGLTAYQTPDGLLAELRDLRNNQPIAGQNVTLYAKNNRILGEAKTDAQGIARFSAAQTGGEDADAPGHLISQHDGHLAYLRVAGQEIDLSDKGLSGEAETNRTLTHWSWHDRGVYRPKDTINALWLFKTPEGKAYSDSPLWLEIRRPDGALVHSELLKADDSGAYRYSADIPANARLGNWQIRLSLGKDGARLVDETYRVDSIVPRQIESKLTIKTEGDNKASLDLKADWLYGAPAADLQNDGVWRITKGDLAKTYPAWAGWQIGRHDETVAAYDQQRIATANTDKDGKRHIELTLERPFDTRPQALWAMTTLTAPDGSPIAAENETLLPRSAPYIALKAGDNNAQIALINDKGEQQSNNLKWTLYRVERDWYWYYSDGDWRYEKNDSRQPEKTGSIATDGKTPATLELPLTNGLYVLEVQGDDPASAASIEIARGWYGEPGNNSPSTITLATDHPTYKHGDTLTLNLEAPFDGAASVKIASRDAIIASHDLTLKNGKAQLQIPWQDDWEQGVWLLANAWNDKSDDHNRRAVGLHWLGADLAHRRLTPQIKLPENPLPEQPLDLEISVPDAGDNTWVNIAVVDDGLYQLTAPSFSDPLEAYYGKKILGLELYDTFGSIVRQTNARLAALRSGADGEDSDSERAALAALPDLDLILVANWSGPLKLGADGKVQYSVPLPHYNGRLRVMTAAWNSEKIGTGEQTAIVKAPVVAELQSPRYLTQDDSGVFTLRLHNTTDKAQNLNIKLETEGLELAGEPIPESTLAPDQVATLRYPYRSNKAGDAHIKIAISGDYNETLERRIPVRAPTLPQVRNQYQRLDAGATHEYTDLADARLTLNSGIPYNAEPYQKQLADYPLGCSEQTTGKLWGLIGAATPDRDSIRQAENRLANLAAYDGSYSLWGYGNADTWLTAYVGEALIELQKHDQLLNPSQLSRLLKNLRENTDGSYNAERAHSDSYTYYTLAYAGEPVRGNLLRYHREAGDKLDRNDSLDIAAALALLGEYQAASERLATVAAVENSNSYPYSSTTSLAAHNLVRLKQLETLWQNVKNDPNNTADNIGKQFIAQRDALAQALSHDRYLSTQELAWLVRLATVAPKLAADTAIEINGKKATLADLGKEHYNGKVRITNPGKQPLWLEASDLHAPAADKASSAGWNIALRYETADGKVLDPGKLPNNTDISITATFTPKLERNASQSDLVYVYSLPAGISLNPLRSQTVSEPEDDDRVNYQYRENRDDRHIATFTLRGEPKAFSYTIYGRTTRVGTWHTPGATLENMYHPEEHARQAAQTIVVE